MQHKGVPEEVECLTAFVVSRLTQDKTLSPGQVLVLATRRRIGYSIRDALKASAKTMGASWDAQSFFHEQSLEVASAQRGFVLLSLLADPDDRAALRAWLALGDPTLGRAGAYARLMAYCKKEGTHPREALGRIAGGEVKVSYVGPLLGPFRELEEQLANLSGLKGPLLADRLFPNGDPGCAEIRVVALKTAEFDPDPQAMLEDLRTVVTQPEIPGESDDVVRVMSLHKAKGLTARIVLIAGCVSGALPTIEERAPAQEKALQLEEQRRLFYVAITRATETLIISGPASMAFKDAKQMGVTVFKHQGNRAVLQASRFISELGPLAPKTLAGDAWRKQLGF